MEYWILYHGLETYNREDYSIFYANNEIFDDEQEALDREEEIINIQKNSACDFGDCYTYIQGLESGKVSNTEMYE